MTTLPIAPAAPVKQAAPRGVLAQPVGACLASTSPGVAGAMGEVVRYTFRLDCPVRNNGDRGPRA